CGANPMDDTPDSAAIQTCIDGMADGDTLVFSSAGGRAGYRGYLIDKTLFAVTRSDGRPYLTFTSTDPPARVGRGATADLKGFVPRVGGRSRVANRGRVDHVTFAALHIDGNRGHRLCMGPNGMIDGVDDNWGSWLPECTVTGDPWCSPGS